LGKIEALATDNKQAGKFIYQPVIFLFFVDVRNEGTEMIAGVAVVVC
jgi:hypothetical protein